MSYNYRVTDVILIACINEKRHDTCQNLLQLSAKTLSTKRHTSLRTFCLNFVATPFKLVTLYSSKRVKKSEMGNLLASVILCTSGIREIGTSVEMLPKGRIVPGIHR